jgi:GNAT superfamily N-acetyltransferase
MARDWEAQLREWGHAPGPAEQTKMENTESQIRAAITAHPRLKLHNVQEERLAELAAEHLGSAADDYLELLARFDAAHPRAEPHYYLTLLGTHPAHRGRGIGMWLLAHDLELIDREHRPAYLESSNPANNRRYESVGFARVGEFSYPGNGPLVMTMWRSAR